MTADLSHVLTGDERDHLNDRVYLSVDPGTTVADALAASLALALQAQLNEPSDLWGDVADTCYIDDPESAALFDRLSSAASAALATVRVCINPDHDHGAVAGDLTGPGFTPCQWVGL